MNKEILQEAIDTFGEKHQIDKYIEESAELTQAVLKIRDYQEQNEGDYTPELLKNVLTEVADVYVTLEYIKKIYNIEKKELEDEIDYKVKRLKGEITKWKSKKW